MSTSTEAAPAPQNPGKVPALCLHKGSGQGFVRLGGKTFYLGRYDDPATEQKYHQLIAEWLACGRNIPQDAQTISVMEVLDQYWAFAQTYYVTMANKPTTEQAHFKQLVPMVRKLYGHVRAADFGPLALKALRQQMIEKGWCRININHHVGRIKRIFRWATENEMVPGSTYHALQAVAGLKRGRCQVKEGRFVRPVPMEMVNAVKPFVSEQVWAIIQLQLLTAARSGEIVIMRPCDINREGKIWTYTPVEHKTAYHGHERTIYIGPQAQGILSRYLINREPQEYCFSPIEAEAARRERMFAQRKTPLSCGNKPGSNRRGHLVRKFHQRYDSHSYATAIKQACVRAFRLPPFLARKKGESVEVYKKRLKPEEKAQIKQWRKDHHWHPHQLRHNAATELRKEFGLETARIILGHRSPAITTIYAEEDRRKAMDVMFQVG
ncbi:MAG: site-specific integrase [Planctomycetaceae bacterium]|nr:site-specific integrase [Planctomycetaceae bacterium]